MSVINCEEVKRDEFHTEKYYDSYNIFGAHIVTEDEMRGVRFTVWAPHAKAMSVVGDFNEWDYEQHKMLQVTEEGIWSLFIPHIEEEKYINMRLKRWLVMSFSRQIRMLYMQK